MISFMMAVWRLFIGGNVLDITLSTQEEDDNLCGAHCSKMVFDHFGLHYTIRDLKHSLSISEEGVGEGRIAWLFKVRGFRVRRIDHPTLGRMIWELCMGRMILISTNKGTHHAIVYGYRDGDVFVADSLERGLKRYCTGEFYQKWDSDYIVAIGGS